MDTTKNGEDPVSRPIASASVPGIIHDCSSQTSSLPGLVLGLLSSLFPAYLACICVRHEYDLIQQYQALAASLVESGGGMRANGVVFESWIHWAIMLFELCLVTSLLPIIIVIVWKCSTHLLPTAKSKASYTTVAILAYFIITGIFLFFTRT